MKRWIILLCTLLFWSGAAQAAPAWSELTPAQREVLSAMQTQWDGLPNEDQQRFSALALRCSQMPPHHQRKNARAYQSMGHIKPRAA
ncbi:DUF3106 domain-containing protein [Deefgea sp. CFH1-16]|uniref:DUF3106 domain-containing protein n=1 Tax=Deefgea sp. CFH1-16 TaxID=2675457 RepID=UPI0015F584A7|nr:DUF3106 domain-containing protein [Deefgea sp. CFH1-16]MBM5574738.1 DUF3106 domain-containing protein [Deefgea sp. CFH1-16]